MQLPCDDVGIGPAVVLLHAGVADRRMWGEHLDPIASAGYRVIAPDLPGFGQAPASVHEAPWSDVLETMDALGVTTATLVGNSFGGAIALSIAVLAPARVRALLLVSVTPEARGLRVGERLIEACLERCRAHGAQSLGWQTALDNHRAQRLYDRVGAAREQWLDYSLEVE